MAEPQHCPTLDEFELYAYVGEDEFGSGEIGLKQGIVPAGTIALVAVRRDKLDRPQLRAQLQAQVDRYGKPITLIRLTYAETIFTLEPGGN